MEAKLMMAIELIEAIAILLLAFYLFRLYRELGTTAREEVE